MTLARARSPRAAAAALALAALLALPGGARAQQPGGTVAGRVTSDAGEPLGGATIFVTGTQRGAIARGDGSYRVQLPAGRYVVRARLIGYTVRADTVDVADGQTVTRDFVLARSTTQLSAVAVVGTRGEARTVIDAPVPIDVLTAADIKTTGRTETAQIIQSLAPSFNFPRATIGDGTDHSRPATLRGLGPDQVLVLVNGKRRHTSALINVNGTVGRGSAGVDLNAIPASMIDRIEVLRDGAAAQYGSDAIAGVINIVLKAGTGSEVTGTVGQAYTSFLGEQKRDGEVAQGAVNYGRVFGNRGYLHGGVEIRDRGFTNRTLGDPRPQTFAENAARLVRSNETGPVNHRQGDAAVRDVGGFLNFSAPLGGTGAELYGSGGGSHRDGEAAGFFRIARDDRTVRSIYPNGFLPLIATNIDDGSGLVGIKGELAGGLRYDLSTTYGRNSFQFLVQNSANVSLGASSPTDFDAGTLKFGQSTTNLDVFREFRFGSGFALRSAAGGEYRRDQFDIEAGEPDSYRNGGARILDGPNAGAQPAVGSQVFPGFQPADAGSHSRSNVAGYVDLETDLTAKLLVGVAGRAENYSDFGSTTTGKVNARFEPVQGYAVRGAAQTGFRAPSLQQSFYSATATNFIAGQPFDVKTFPVASAPAKLLGARELKAETSRNYSVGLAIEPLPSLSITADLYRVDIDDRIVLSGNFTTAAVRNFLAANGAPGIGGGRYFTNAIDTRTNGLDVVANYGANFGSYGVTRLTAGFNSTRSRVTALRTNTPQALGDLGAVLFDRVERVRIEKGQPKNTILFSAAHTWGGATGFVRTQRYGEVTSFGVDTVGSPNNVDQVFGSTWVSDASVGYTYRRATLTVGADNIFDNYPDRNNNNGNPLTTFGGNAQFGIFPYNGISPFGFNGRFVYTRIAFGL
jgi:iron complex outermembrane receptor protein